MQARGRLGQAPRQLAHRKEGQQADARRQVHQAEDEKEHYPPDVGAVVRHAYVVELKRHEAQRCADQGGHNA